MVSPPAVWAETGPSGPGRTVPSWRPAVPFVVPTPPPTPDAPDRSSVRVGELYWAQSPPLHVGAAPCRIYALSRIGRR